MFLLFLCVRLLRTQISDNAAVVDMLLVSVIRSLNKMEVKTWNVNNRDNCTIGICFASA